MKWLVLVSFLSSLAWGIPVAPKLCQVECGATILMRWISPDKNINGLPLTDLTAHRVYYSNTPPFGIKPAWKEFIELPGNLTGHSYEEEIHIPIDGIVYLAMTAISGGEESGYSNVLVKINE